MTTVITFDEPKLEQQKLLPDDITAWFPRDWWHHSRGFLNPVTSPQGFGILMTSQRDLDLRRVSLYAPDLAGPLWHSAYTHHKAPTGSVPLCLSDSFLIVLRLKWFLKIWPRCSCSTVDRCLKNAFLCQGQIVGNSVDQQDLQSQTPHNFMFYCYTLRNKGTNLFFYFPPRWYDRVYLLLNFTIHLYIINLIGIYLYTVIHVYVTIEMYMFPLSFILLRRWMYLHCSSADFSVHLHFSD